MKIYIRFQTDYYYPIRYVLKLIGQNQKVGFDFVTSGEEADLIWDHSDERSQPINLLFYQSLHGDLSDFPDAVGFGNFPAIFTNEGQKDEMATIFYMVNCIQELKPSEDALDQYGRFKYERSYQARFNNIEQNLVQDEIDNFIDKHKLKGTKNRSSVFISHDIDSIYGSIVQDGFWALKNRKFSVMLRLIVNELLQRPHWKNIDRILKMNSEYDIHSTFFWLVNKGIGADGVKNADYDFLKEIQLAGMVRDAGSFNGLHKSCSRMSIDEELQKGHLETLYNRYHFLKFRSHDDWQRIADSQIKLDCSLGFAERYGFRNSYGKPFQPFNLKENKPFSFVVAPLHFMDTTLRNYMNMPVELFGDTFIHYYEKNKYNCVLSLLWHNSGISDYKFAPMLREYKKIAAYLYENQVHVITPAEIIDEGNMDW